MKTTVSIPTEIDIKTVGIEVAVRYEEEDIPNDFPLRDGDMWRAMVDIDTGKIRDWPQGKSGDLYMKVCDEGSYALYAEDGRELAILDGDYVPHGVVPGEYGDYIDLKIDETGAIKNWPKKFDFSAFFSGDK